MLKPKSPLPKFSLVLLILDPEAFRLESLAVEEDEVALPILLGPVAQGGDHDVAICQAVGGVRGAHSKSVHLPRLNELGRWNESNEWKEQSLGMATLPPCPALG